MKIPTARPQPRPRTVEDPIPASRPGGAVTRRSLLIGVLACILIAVGAPSSEDLLRGSYMALDYSTPAAVFFLFVLTALVNPLLRRVAPRQVFSPSEIIVIYTMMIAACALVTMGMASQFVPTLAAARYYGQTQAAWKTQVLPYIRPALLPGAHASERLFTGLKPGESIPWGDWARPLAIWSVLLLSFYTFSISLMAIFRRQWVDRERLAYPLVQLPVEVAGAGGRKSLLQEPVMWMGFATAFGIASMRGLHHYFPSFPDAELVWHLPAFQAKATFTVRVSFPMIGFFYLANAEAVFSLWVFNRVAWLAQAWMKVIGLQYESDLGPYSTGSIFGFLAIGAFLGLAGTTVWSARPHLKDVLRTALRRQGADDSQGVDDSQEPMSYRAACCGVAGGLLVMAGWLLWAGMSFVVLLVFMVGVVIIFLGLTRVVIESGMAEAVPPGVPAGFTQAVLGSQVMGPHAIAAQSMSTMWAGDLRTTVMTSAANAYRMSDVLGGEARALTRALFLAIIVTAPCAVATTLYLGYTHGGAGLNAWFFIDGAQLPYQWIAVRNTNPAKPDPVGWALAIAGALLTWGLAVLRQRYVWWPFHPAGFAIGPTWIIDELWFSAFLAWLLRALAVRYGGLPGFQRARPYFLGLILGQFTCNGFWLILDALSGARGNQIFWI